MKRVCIGFIPLLLAAVVGLVFTPPAVAGVKIADNPGITVGGTGEDFNWASWQGWWVRYGSTHIDFTFTGIDTNLITDTHVLVNFDLGVTNRASGETGLDGLVDIVINPGEAPESTYTLANVLFDNVDPLNHVYLLGGGGSYGTHASILVNKSYILGTTLVIRVVRNTDSNLAPTAPACTNQPIDMSTQPPTVPLDCYEQDDAHTVHISVITTDETGTVAADDEVTLWQMADGEIIRDNPRVEAPGGYFNWASWQGYWVRYGSTYIDFTFSGLRPATIPDQFVLVIFNLGVTNHSNGETGLDGLVDFVINPERPARSYTVASELLDNMDHLNHVYLLGGGGTYTTKAVLAVNKYYIDGKSRTLRIRVKRQADSDGAPTAPACTNQPIDMSTDPPTIPLNVYEADIAERAHIYVRTWSSWGQFADDGVATMYAKHYEFTEVALTSCSAVERDGYVALEWTTASELDNAGFNIYRSAGEHGAKTKLNRSLIPARGTALEGADYSFKDYDVAGGDRYYWVEDVSLDGTTGMSGPVLAAPRETPTAFSLAQNYPNPFNPVTEISYQLPADCHVKLEVFGVLGRKVATLVDEHQPAGNRTVHWNAGADVASGIYFYRLQAGDFVEMKKMVLLR